MKKKAAAKKVAKVMREYKAGTLHAGKDPKGPKKAPIVKSRKEAWKEKVKRILV
jgi:protein-arginine kinase activator protein McsA